MNVEYKDFIGIYTDVYPEGYCSHLIKEFDRHVSQGAGSNRQESEGALKHFKSDFQLNIKYYENNLFNDSPIEKIFFDGLQYCFEKYTEKYSILKNTPLHTSSMKMQKTSPGEGYHLWHCEQDAQHPERVLVYILYLNTLKDEDAGETEFLYQQLRIKPIENTMVFWPAAYTHAHRGNVVHGNISKYIVTGWFYYGK